MRSGQVPVQRRAGTEKPAAEAMSFSRPSGSTKVIISNPRTPPVLGIQECDFHALHLWLSSRRAAWRPTISMRRRLYRIGSFVPSP